MSNWIELGDDVFALRYPFYDQQIGVVVGDGGVLVIDTRSSHAQAEEVRRDLRLLTNKPVTVVVNTHGHYDHCFGNRVFRPSPIWGHVRCREMIERTGEYQREELVANVPQLGDDFRAVEIDPPDCTFDNTATVDVGGREVELRYLGRGHTDNDIVVRMPDAGVLFAGDLLENGAPPYFRDGFPMDWPETVERLLALVEGPVVPGHGDAADRSFVERQLGELRTIAELAHRVEGGELDLEAAIQRAPYGADASREPLDRAVAQLRGELTASW